MLLASECCSYLSSKGAIAEVGCLIAFCEKNNTLARHGIDKILSFAIIQC